MLGLALSACQDAAVFEKVYAFENEVWDLKVKPTFKVEIKDLEKEYDFILTLRTTTDYEYSNLWIFLNTTTPSGKIGREPFEIKTTLEDGSWAGKKTGTVVEFPLYFKRRKFPEKGTYTFMLEQAITKSSVNEVLDIGLRLEEVKK